MFCLSRHSTISMCRMINSSRPSPSQESPMVPLFQLGRFTFRSPTGNTATTAPSSSTLSRSHPPAVQRHPRVPNPSQFMAVTHHGYNVLKMPGSGGVIIVPCEERDAVCSLERAFQAAAIEDPDRRSGRPPEATLKKKKTSPGQSHNEAGTSEGIASGFAPDQGAPPSRA